MQVILFCVHVCRGLAEVGVSNVDELMGLNYWFEWTLIPSRPFSRRIAELPSRITSECEVNKKARCRPARDSGELNYIGDAAI